MINYIRAERLKCKHTTIKGLSWGTPFVLMMLSFILTEHYFVIDNYNWWYIAIMPVILTLNCCLFTKLESKMKYRAILPLSLSMQKIWYAKVYIMIEQLVISCMLIFVTSIVGVNLLKIIGITSKSNVTVINMFLASLVIGIVGMWQIPIILFLSDKLGIFLILIMNAGSNILFSITLSLTRYWIVVPYSYAARLMCPILKILPNGLVAKEGSVTFYNELLSWDVVIPGILISILLLVSITYVTGKRFSKKEAV